MVTQYPHIIIINPQPGDALLQNGIWTTPAPGTPVEQACRYEPSQITRQIKVADGLVITYKGIVFLPLSSPEIQSGVSVNIVGVVEGAKTLYFYRGQLNCSLYI